VVQAVTLSGYAGIAMEPFVSRDGRYLLFNTSNDPAADTDLLYATRIDDLHWNYAGPVAGINTPALEGTPTMDDSGQLFFVSTRSYSQTSCTVYSGRFTAGSVSDIQLVDSICRHQPGIVNFDVDVDPSGTLMTFVDSQFGPENQPTSAVLVMARWNGTQFVRTSDSATILAAVNSGVLQYAPAISRDLLTLWFTRAASTSGADSPQIYRAQRSTTAQPFEAPVLVEGLGDFVEAPALSPDEKLLYFHRRDGATFNIHAVSIG
jgi:Tol biopolymer transport system component